MSDFYTRAMKNPAVRKVVVLESLRDDFLAEIERVMKRDGVSRAEMAQRMKCSRPNITMALQGAASIGRFSQMAAALGCRFTVELRAVEATT